MVNNREDIIADYPLRLTRRDEPRQLENGCSTQAADLRPKPCIDLKALMKGTVQFDDVIHSAYEMAGNSDVMFIPKEVVLPTSPF
jgi:hypothetical protein